MAWVRCKDSSTPVDELEDGRCVRQGSLQLVLDADHDAVSVVPGISTVTPIPLSLMPRASQIAVHRNHFRVQAAQLVGNRAERPPDRKRSLQEAE